MTSEQIVTIIIAIAGSGGIWGVIQYLLETKVTKNKESLKAITDKLSKVATSDEVLRLSNTISDIYAELEMTKDVALASARDRLNQLSNKYLELGYIPLDDYVAYKALGDSYINADGNSEIKAKFNLVMDSLEVKSVK